MFLLSWNLWAQAPKSEITISTVQNIYWKAIKLYSDENYSQAILYFDHLLVTDKYNYEYNYYTGMCFYYLNKPKLARFYFSNILEDTAYRLKVIYYTRNEN